MAEGTKVITRAIAAGYTVRSVLLAESRLADLPALGLDNSKVGAGGGAGTRAGGGGGGGGRGGGRGAERERTRARARVRCPSTSSATTWPNGSPAIACTAARSLRSTASRCRPSAT